jgi:TonB-dependent SusC/RagA subfamily outer membrane receptor
LHRLESLRRRLYVAESHGRLRTTESVAAKCSHERAAAIAYIVDGKAATCESAMALSADRIASVEILKGAAAAQYGVSAEGGVIIIQTKRDR